MPQARRIPSAPAAVFGRAKIAGLVKVLASPKGAKIKETELFPDFIGKVFEDALGYARPAVCVADDTTKRESLDNVDRISADATIA